MKKYVNREKVSKVTEKTLLLSLDIKAVQVHDLGPRRNEILHKLLLRICATIDLRDSTQLSVRSEDQISAGSSPLDGLGGAVSAGPELTTVVFLGPRVGGREKVDEEIVGQLALLLGENTVGRTVVVGVQGTETTDEDCHLRRSKGKKSSAVNEDLLSASTGSTMSIVTETISKGLKVTELNEICLVLGSVNTAGSERNLDVLEASSLGSLLNSSNTTEDNQISERNLLGAGLGVEVLLDLLQCRKNLLELLRVVACPADLRLKGNTSTVGTTTLVSSTEGRSRVPSSRNKLGNIKAISREDSGLEAGDLSLANDVTLSLGERILPDKLLLSDLGAKVARNRAEITVEELVPGASKSSVQLLGVVVPALTDLEVRGVVDEGEITGEHGGAAELALDEGVGVLELAVESLPLLVASGALDEGPVVAEKRLKEVVAPPMIC
jgi:hypothetical protein